MASKHDLHIQCKHFSTRDKFSFLEFIASLLHKIPTIHFVKILELVHSRVINEQEIRKLLSQIVKVTLILCSESEYNLKLSTNFTVISRLKKKNNKK